MSEKCHFCNSTDLIRSKHFPSLKRVTSDLKSWPSGGEFAICKSCLHPQSLTTKQWHEDAEKIYSEYRVTLQSEGAEQSVFNAKTGKPIVRSEALLAMLKQNITLTHEGKILDFGCGNGALLKAFSKTYSDWDLYGSDLNTTFINELKRIPRFSRYYSNGLNSIDNKFNLISLIHTLEHIPSPKAVLKELHEKLEDDGLLLVQVPDCETNPFVLLVADHCSHFSANSAATLIENCGFEILYAVNNWIPKEVTVLAKKIKHSSPKKYRVNSDYGNKLLRHIEWLQRIATLAEKTSTETNFGIFGTSVASIWLNGHLNNVAHFFIDEDPNRIGQKIMGKPVLSPSDAPQGSSIFVPLPPSITALMVNRLNQTGVNYVFTPEL
jgi:2-polyprenyl-3-methyl-5-hydroxy-6-metoxy-1,4-benzoquinol methylase